MPNYVAYLRGTKDAQAHLGPDEAQQVLQRYLAWSAALADAGTLQTGGALSPPARAVSCERSRARSARPMARTRRLPRSSAAIS